MSTTWPSELLQLENDVHGVSQEPRLAVALEKVKVL
jgi:hypothetical protein